METYRKFGIVTMVCVLMAYLSAVTPAKVIYVDDDAGGTDDGSSWTSAYVHLQRALAAASAGDEVRVAQGMYKPDPGPATMTPTAPTRAVRVSLTASDELYTSFMLKSGVSVRGGFAGLGAQDPDVRDVRQYESILNGDLNDNDDDSLGPWHPRSRFFRWDNSQHVVTSDKVDATAVLDGFVITGAGDSALYNSNGSPSVRTCTFRRNFGQSGGALRSEGGSPSLSHCEFQENHAASSGGAIYAHRTSLTLVLVECRFLHNAALGAGGGISTYQGTVSLTDCAFDGNAAENGGAVYATYYQAAVLTGCRFGRNLALNRGGAVYAQAGPLMSDSLMTLTGCTFNGNTATRAGALYTEGRYLPEHAVALDHCLFTGNWARDTGGAVAVDLTPLIIASSTFADNWAKTWPTLDWRCSLWGPSGDPAVNMMDCILWDSEPSIVRTATLWGGQKVDTAGTAIAIIYSDVRGGWPGQGNIDADPLLGLPGYWSDAEDPSVVVQPDAPNAIWVDGDYHLKSQAGRWDPAGESWTLDEVTSPCIDAGDPGTLVGDEPEPNGGRVNMGAYGGTAQASKSDGAKP